MKIILLLSGSALILIGMMPLTPLIWLLVLVPDPLPSILSGVRLQFWQTQTIGAFFIVIGVMLVRNSSRFRRRS